MLIGAEGIDADGNVQAVGEFRHLAGAAVRAEVLEDHDAIATGFSSRCRKRVFDAGGHPQPPCGVELQVHRLVDVRLGRDELDLESRRQRELCGLLGGRQRRGGANPQGEFVLGGELELRDDGGKSEGQQDGGAENHGGWTVSLPVNSTGGSLQWWREAPADAGPWRCASSHWGDVDCELCGGIRNRPEYGPARSAFAGECRRKAGLQTACHGWTPIWVVEWLAGATQRGEEERLPSPGSPEGSPCPCWRQGVRCR